MVEFVRNCYSEVLQEAVGTQIVPRSTKNRLSLIFLAILLFYIFGIFIRREYGVRVDISNNSGLAVHQVSLEFVGWKYRYELPISDFAPGQRKHVFFRPGRKSHFNLKFTDSQGLQHTEAVEGYVAGDDCSRYKVTILPSNSVAVTIPTHPLVCWESWFGFL